jgi:hypothetical protein
MVRYDQLLRNVKAIITLEAYAWPYILTNGQILERLLALNRERCAP